MAIPRSWLYAAALLLLLVAVAAAARVVVPVRADQVGFDSAASVLYFDRLVAGERLEAFVTATPKPALTLLLGSLHALTGDWRVLSWATILVFGIAVVLAAWLAARVAGPRAGLFATAALIGSVPLMLDVSLAYAVAWALAGWLAAGVALTGDRPRYLLAGAALLFAALVRFETLIIVGVAGLALVGGLLASRWRPALRPPPGAWWLLLGLAALPLQAVHDLLLTGDPGWSFGVPVAGSEGAPLVGVGGVLRMAALRYAEMAPLLVLGVLGVVLLVRRGSWPVLLGLLAVGPGTIAFLVFLALREVYVSARYFLPADLAVLFAAAVGFAGLTLAPIVRPGGTADARVRVGAGLIVAAIAGASLGPSFAPVDADLRTSTLANLDAHKAARAAIPALAGALDSMPGVRDRPASPDPDPAADHGTPSVLVPALMRPHLAVDLGLPLTQIGGLNGRRVATDGTHPAPGQLVYHERNGDVPAAAFGFLEVTEPTCIGAIRLVPVDADPAAGWWVLRVEDACG